ncbi:PH and SEC7 domain-containing protein 1-like protein [Lates japonicus]|uniref:PH and SEC7 domain-containing protein 1-like protein n=1 Tax=Lates japonicus TaxID=270547 RepID=A0AAD3RI97_LATJO|nr:PH and SEC7 domain-containing protein 1-like protein [Lates japonicus]
MIGVNSIHSTGRMRSRSLCSVRSGRDSRDTDPFRYPRTPRSRSLKPLAFPDLLGKTQDGQQHLHSRKKKTLYSSIKNEKLQWTISGFTSCLLSAVKSDDEEELRKSMSELVISPGLGLPHYETTAAEGNSQWAPLSRLDGELYKTSPWSEKSMPP